MIDRVDVRSNTFSGNDQLGAVVGPNVRNVTFTGNSFVQNGNAWPLRGRRCAHSRCDRTCKYVRAFGQRRVQDRVHLVQARSYDRGPGCARGRGGWQSIPSRTADRGGCRRRTCPSCLLVRQPPTRPACSPESYSAKRNGNCALDRHAVDRVIPAVCRAQPIRW